MQPYVIVLITTLRYDVRVRFMSDVITFDDFDIEKLERAVGQTANIHQPQNIVTL